MKKIKEILNVAKGYITNKWVLFSLVSLMIALFAVWYGAWWSIFITIPLVYDYYISKYIASYHKKMCSKYAWWRIAWAVWCALVFALIVGVLIYMLIFRWNSSNVVLYIVIAAVFAYALWEEISNNGKVYEWLYSWVHAIIFATVVATLIQLYWFQMFVIPTGSMESTLLAGDYILVNKVTYGPRVPMTPLSFPFVHNTMPLNDTKPSFSEAWTRSYRRLAGTGQVERGDVVVFNYPEGDTVVLEYPAISYYELLANGNDILGIKGKTEAERRRSISEQYTIAVRPMDKKENYIKRCVGMPGDSLEVVDGVVYTNDVKEMWVPKRQFTYRDESGASINPGICYDEFGRSVTMAMPVTDEEVDRYAKSNLVKAGKEYTLSGDLIPHLTTGDASTWTLDDFGPIWIPKAGATIELTPENWAMYGRCIAVYEQRSVKVERAEDGTATYYIDGKPATEYTFLMDYYFMMGDNRHQSLDSRFWGFVPEDHIVGKAMFVWFSRDPMSGDIRWDRIFTSIE